MGTFYPNNPSRYTKLRTRSFCASWLVVLRVMSETLLTL